MARAIQVGIDARRRVLSDLTFDQQVSLLEQLLLDFFSDQHLVLQKWSALTGQTAQVDTGYISQFIASIVLRCPGQGFRGKGDDLTDGSEVKSAANISGVDAPRWNHNLGKPADDEDRIAKGEIPVWREYLASPYIFYVLADRAIESTGSPIRVRAWCVDGQNDSAWRGLVNKFVAQRTPKRYNLQLHPPVGYDDNIVVNTLGNLDMSEVLVFDARLRTGIGQQTTVEWARTLGLPPSGAQTTAMAYGGRTARARKMTDASHIVADIEILPSLFPDVFTEVEKQALRDATIAEVEGD